MRVQDAAQGATCAPPGAAPGYLYTLAALAFLGHNVEEGLGLGRWAAGQGVATLDPAGLTMALVWVTLGATILLLLGRTLQLTTRVQRLVAVLAGALLVNVGAHLGFSLAARSLMPGVVTAVLLIAPAFGWLMWRLPLPRRDKLVATAAGAALLPVVSYLALRLSGALG